MLSLILKLRFTFILPLFLFGACKAQLASGGYEVTFPLNKYLQTSATSPYPSLIQAQVNSLKAGKFINVMDYGAKGNGLVADDAAISAAFAACTPGKGLIFPTGKTFLIKNLIQVPIYSDITVLAEGATFKMADNTGYNAIALELQGGNYANNIVWIGGTWNGNKDKQSWPGSPTKNDNWSVTQGNYGLLTIRNAKFALVKNVHLFNTVYDGVDLYECKLGVIAESTAEGGAPLNYKYILGKYGQGHQSTYFKATRNKSQAVYFLDLTSVGGSIGVQYSTIGPNDNSLAVINNCNFTNQAQDAMHFEDCKQVFVNNCVLKAEKNVLYHEDIHLSNQTNIASLKNSSFYNAKVDFRNASRLQIGVVENCTFDSNLDNSEDSTNLSFFVHNATHIIKSKIKGRTPDAQVSAKYISETSFENFNIASKGVEVAENCSFNNGKFAILAPRSNSIIQDCSFTNISKAESLLGKLSGKPGKKRANVINSVAEIPRGLSRSTNIKSKFKVPIVVTNQDQQVIGNIN